MKCWRCDQNDTQIGQMFCDTCRGIHKQQKENNTPTKQRHKPDPFTYIYFCRVCGVEVYRREHVRIRTKKILTDIEQKARLALVQHMERVDHERASLTGALCINERYGDDELEVKGTEQKCPSDAQASRVLKILGMLP